MAVLYITEYAEGAWSALGTVSMAKEPAITEQHVAIGGVSAQSAAFGNSTGVIRVHTDAICSIAFGSNPTAVTTAKRLAANQTEYFDVRSIPGGKVAVIANT